MIDPHLPRPSQELIARYDVAGPRYTSYPTVPCWSEDVTPQVHEKRLSGLAATQPLSLYVHLPFCRSLCWYCGCSVVIAKDSQAADLYLDHVSEELNLLCRQLGSNRSLTQIHWGGGTPTYLDEGQIERLWRDIAARFRIEDEAEISIEIHPSMTRPSQLTLLRSLGFNRLSMGLQDFDPAVQQATHRVQTVEQTQALVSHAHQLGFGGINFDLIYGLPFQTPASWARSLKSVLDMRPDRVAVYSFAFIPEVLKHQRRMPREALPDAPTKLDLFMAAAEAFLSAGYVQIGMDHFALPEDSLALAQRSRTLGRNFQGYTATRAPDTVGVGVTSISDIDGLFAQNVRPLKKYYEAIRAGHLATERGFALNAEDRQRRHIIQSLMCNFWVDLGSDLPSYAAELSALAPFETDGLVVRKGSEIEVTTLGRMFVRNVARVFDARTPVRPAKFSRTV